MNSHIKLFLNILCILSFIACSEVKEEIIKEQNNFKEINLSKNDYQIIFKIGTPKDQYMIVDYFFSHPSKVENTAFCQYDGKVDDNTTNIYSTQEPSSEESQNANMLYFDEDMQAIFLNPKRRLSSECSENQEDLIIKEENNFGKNKVVLKLTEDMENIILSIFRKEDANLDKEEKLFIKYRIIEEEVEGPIYSLSNSKIDLTQEKDMLNITFDGITYNKKIDIANIIVNYEIKLYDKEELESNFENSYTYAFDFDKTIKPLFSTKLLLKGEMTTKKNFLVIKAPAIENKKQSLFIYAKIKNLDDEELLLYEIYNDIEVKEKSEEKQWPDEDKDGKDEKDENGDEDKDKDKDKIDPKKNREKNRKTLILILSFFVGSVFVTFIVVFIYLKFCAKKDINIEEDQDYKDVGGIVTTNENQDKDKKETKEDTPKINEEEE